MVDILIGLFCVALLIGFMTMCVGAYILLLAFACMWDEKYKILGVGGLIFLYKKWKNRKPSVNNVNGIKREIKNPFERLNK